jgi:cell division protein FtsB
LPGREFFTTLGRFNFRWAIFLAVFVLSSVYFFVFGESGILERMNLEKEKNNVESKITALKKENEGLHQKLNRYRQGQYPGEDYLNSGYVKPGDKVLMFRGQDKQPSPDRQAVSGSDRYTGILPYLRIIWVVISVALVLGLYLYERKLKSRVPS